jgi:hypothetical protein
MICTKEKEMISSLEIAKLLQDALNTQPTIVSQPNNNDLLALKKKLLDVLQTFIYNRVGSVHHVLGVIQSMTAYKADHNGGSFPISQRIGLWDDKISKDATVVGIKKAETIHKART